MNCGDFLVHNDSCVGARVVADLPYDTNKNTISDNNSIISAAAISQPMSAAQNPMFNVPGLSLALQTGMESGQGDHQLGGRILVENNNDNNNHNSKYENIGDVNGAGIVKSQDPMEVESYNVDDGSEEDHDGSDNLRRKKKYHRHTRHQIQELEALFKECPHPDEKQRVELSRRLSLDTRQVKFWFQNRRTQLKTQHERHENSSLRQQNDKLRAQNMSIKEVMRNPICSNCGGPAKVGEISLEEQHLMIENTRLKNELDRMSALNSKFLRRPISSLGPPPIPSSSLELGDSSNVFGDLSMLSSALPLVPGLGPDPTDFPDPLGPMMSPQEKSLFGFTPSEESLARPMYLELALAAMEELMKMAQMSEPIWIGGLEVGREVLNRDEYLRTFSPCIWTKPDGFVSEGSREIGMVIIDSLALVEALMDSNKWAEMFPCIIAKATTTEVISYGMGGTRNGALQLMDAELQVLSPLVPIRKVNFLRFCKQHEEGVWALVDVSIDTISEEPTFPSCRRLPSGCVIQDMSNGYCKVTWVEHAEYDDSQVHHLYRSSIAAGLGFGARRWLATLQRQCEWLTLSMPSSDHHPVLTSSGRQSLLKLAHRMTNNFCAGVCASAVHEWNKFPPRNVDDDVRVMMRKSVDDPGEPTGIVLSAATSVWLPVSPRWLFDFLRSQHLRSEWDILSNGGPMQEMAHVAKGQDQGNCISLLRAGAINSSQNSMLILQETCIDASGSLVVYAPVDFPAMHLVMSGGDSSYVALLPSGFAIGPDGEGPDVMGGPQAHRVGGSLLTVVFQILVNSQPTAKLSMESVETINNLISCTIHKIKVALQCDS